MKLLFLHSGDNWIRGSEGVLLTVLKRLGRSNFESRVICNQQVMADTVSSLGIVAESQDFPRIYVGPGDVSLPFGQWVSALRGLCRSVREYNPDVIYCNSGTASQLGIFAGLRTRVPVVCHLHSPYSSGYVRWFGFHRAAAVVCVSEAVKSIVTDGIHFRRSPVVIYNGVDTDRFQPAVERNPAYRRRLGIPDHAVVFGQVSSLISRKGVDVFLRARARLKNGYLVFVGEGPERSDFEALARKLKIDEFVKFVGLADPVPYYQHVFNISVLPSRNDALPLSLIEAAACGLPSIGAAVHGIPEIIQNGVNGLLFQSDNDTDLAGAMSRLASDTNFRRQAEQAALQIVKTRFSLERQVRQIENLCLSVVSSRRSDDAVSQYSADPA